MNFLLLQGQVPNSIFMMLPTFIEKFEANTILRLSHFMAQTSHESQNYTKFTENLNYSKDGLLKTFGKYFDDNSAQKYANNPKMIASKVYANRYGNGDEASGDGYKYRGRGAIMTTFKDNYKALGVFLKVDLIENPDLVATQYPLDSAGFFFNSKKIWATCDLGDSIDVITQVSKKVNGGTIGLQERISIFQKFYRLLNQAA